MPEAKSAAPAPAGSDMQRAVVAEQDARRAIAEAETRATAQVEAARAQARAILNAVPGRIERLRGRGTRAVQRAVAQIEAEEQGAMRSLGDTAFPAELMAPTTEALVARLTGAPETPS